MLSFYNNWRYYRLGYKEYKTAMKTAFINNIAALRWANLVFFIMAIIFSVFPIVTEKDFVKAGFYFASAFIALLLFFFTSHKNRQLKIDIQNKKINLISSDEKPVVSKGLIYALIFLYYINVMFFGLYLAVWAEPEKIAGSFIGILICALFHLNISPLLYLGITLTTFAFYVTAIINVKIPSVWNYDIQNALFAISLGLIFGWQIIMNRITSISYTQKLKEENTIDTLTLLKNRRDFMNTFQRFITNYRQSDNFLYIAVLDIDFFKNYNDHYGHPQGDECLRKIGKALNELCKNDGLYAARIGGEEFAVLKHSGNSTDAQNLGEHINQMIRDLNIPHEKSIVAPYITVSVGIHIALCGAAKDIKDLYNSADKALYAAKYNGRNCTVVSI